MSGFFLFLGVRAKEKAVEGGGDRTLGKATLPRRNRFVDLSWPGPLHPVPVCVLFTCLPKISFESLSSHHVHRFHEPIEKFETKRTERNVYLPSNHGYELLIIRASDELLYGFSFSAFLFRVALCLARWSFSR